MKKLFFAMAAMAAMLTSCSKDDAFGGLSHGKVTFEVSAPELTTRADEGKGLKATKLHYAVYDVIENNKVVTGTETLNNLKATVTIDLVEGRDYEVAFWADAGDNSPYIFNADDKTVRYKPNVELKANDENYDAFFAYVPKADVKVGKNVSVTLKRPFAQLNVATNDTTKAANLGVEVVQTGITVDAYTSFNLQTGWVIGEKTSLTFGFNDDTEKMNGQIQVGTDIYDWLTMNYILVQARASVDVTFNFSDELDRNYTRQYTAVPVERNHRTNILGSILTDPTIFSVDINPDMTGDDITIGDFLVGSQYYTNFAVAVGKAIEENKTLTLMQNALFDVVTEPITILASKTLTINLNGHTICGVTDDNVASLFVVNGTLNVKDEPYTSANAATSAAPAALTTRAGDTRGTITFEKDDAAIFTVYNGGTLTINNADIISSYIPVIVDNSGDDQIGVNISGSKLISGGNSPAFWVKDNSDAKLDNVTLGIFVDKGNQFGESGDANCSIKLGDSAPFDVNKDTGYRTDNDKIFWNGYLDVENWDEFTAALNANATKIKLTENIVYNASYTIKNDVTINLNVNKTLEIDNPEACLYIGDRNNKTKPNVTIKGGNLNCMVYGLSGNVTIKDVVFGGTFAYVEAYQGVVNTKYANLLMENCKMTNVKKSGSKKPRTISVEGRTSGYIRLIDCDFSKSGVLDRAYFWSIGGTTILELKNCVLYTTTMASNIDFSGTYSLCNVDLADCKGGFTFGMNRASTSLTDEEMAVYKAIKQNNKGSMRFIFTDGEKNNL